MFVFNNIHSFYSCFFFNCNCRSSNAKVSGEIALTPLRTAVTAMGPSVENLMKERGELVKDYDSYQRRLKVLQEKKKQSAGKPSEAEATGNLLIIIIIIMF